MNTLSTSVSAGLTGSATNRRSNEKTFARLNKITWGRIFGFLQRNQPVALFCVIRSWSVSKYQSRRTQKIIEANTRRWAGRKAAPKNWPIA
jgi:hypothetical protein